MNTSIKLTVFFEGAFWVGVFEKSCDGKYEVAKIVFGSEPKDYEVYESILKNFYNIRFNNSLSLDETYEAIERKVSPKRLQRVIKKETQDKGIGTKAQLAMKLQYETSKVERKKLSREEKEAEKEKRFELRQQKKLMKHRGH